jgi:hypothetical protein
VFWVIVASDWAGSIVSVLGDDDALPGGEWRYRLVAQARDYDRALRLADLERRRLNPDDP